MYESLSKVKAQANNNSSRSILHNQWICKVTQSKTVKLYLVNDYLEDLKSDTCGIFQLYFYTNLFLPASKGQILNDNKLTEKLLNETFTLNTEQNEKADDEFANETDIRGLS